jgi:misacylated tRNA(Ala) deacylase
MTTWLFWQDAYMKEFDAKITSIDSNTNEVVLDQTCFYPAGGGQIFDTGEISGVKVIEVRKDDNDVIYHKIEGPANFGVGDTVHGKIDWDRRHNIMKLHTSAHIIDFVLIKNYGNVSFTGSQIYPDRARMDFNIEKMDDEIMKNIEQKSNEIVKMNLDVVSRIISREEFESNPDLKRLADTTHYDKYKTFRVVEIKTLDVQLDGGTHVANTGEIGKIKIVKRENKGKNNRRITIIVE